MKKLTTLLCLLVLGVALCLPAWGAKKGGFTGGNRKDSEVSTVAEVKKMKDDAEVVLRGKITKQVGKEKYTFVDDTGSITVEIDDDDWDGVSVSEKDTVIIYGEVDKDIGKVTIDVDSIELSRSGKSNSKKKK